MKKTLWFCGLLLAFGMFSCSDDKEDDLQPPIDATLKLKTEKTIIEPFEKLTVRVDLDIDLINESYDSVRWNAAGLWWDGITIPNNEDPRDVHFTNYRLGKHKITLLGYKDGEVISSPSVEYEVVSPRGDFLNVRWGIEKKFNAVNFISGRTPLNYLPTTEGSIKYGGICIERWHIADSEKGEYVDLHLMPWSSNFHFGRSQSLMADVPNIEDINWHPEDDGDRDKWQENHAERVKNETEFWYNYMTTLYGAPLVEYDGDNPKETSLWREYNARFNNPPRGGSFPYVIWETHNTYIAMNHYVDGIGGREVKGIPAILAEPRTKE